MLTIIIPAFELYDERTNSFVYIEKDTTLNLEHSLIAISKWEAKYHKPFLSKENKSDAEILFYVKCMTLTQNVDPNVYLGLTKDNYKAIQDYIEDPMTATTVREDRNGKRNNRIVTAELIYCWMISLHIPFECRKWHINQLLMLIRVCNAENQPPKKGNRANTAKQYAALNAARRKQLNTKG